MGNAASAAALCAAVSAVELVISLLDPHSGAGAATASAHQAQPPHGAVRELLLLAAAGGLFTASTLMNRRIHHAGADNNRRLSDLFALLCASAGVLEFFIFVQPAAAGGMDGMDPGDQQVRALGLAALRALPAAATASFFLGMMLIVVGHIRAGGEGGGGAVAGEGPIQAPVGVDLLTKMAMAVAAAVVCLMAMAIYGA